MRKAKTPVLIFGFVLISASVFVAAEDVRLQPGTWEVKMSGFSMDGVPPAMRAQMEAELSKPHNTCVTAEDIRNFKFGKSNDDDDEDCKVISSTMTRTGGDVVRQCAGDVPTTETIHIEAPTPQTLRASIKKQTAAGSNTLTLTGRFVSAQCKEK
jgi:hypothetical protein